VQRALNWSSGELDEAVRGSVGAAVQVREQTVGRPAVYLALREDASTEPADEGAKGTKNTKVPDGGADGGADEGAVWTFPT
jgi:hypothetical protein